MIEPLRVEVDLACRPDHAFATWTERLGQWWPRGHTVTGDTAQIVLEPRLGGRIYERTSGGEAIDWGEITAWDPPHRLSYRWHMRRDRADATDVEIHFVPPATARPASRSPTRGGSAWARTPSGGATSTAADGAGSCPSSWPPAANRSHETRSCLP